VLLSINASLAGNSSNSGNPAVAQELRYIFAALTGTSLANVAVNNPIVNNVGPNGNPVSQQTVNNPGANGNGRLLFSAGDEESGSHSLLRGQLGWVSPRRAAEVEAAAAAVRAMSPQQRAARRRALRSTGAAAVLAALWSPSSVDAAAADSGAAAAVAAHAATRRRELQVTGGGGMPSVVDPPPGCEDSPAVVTANTSYTVLTIIVTLPADQRDQLLEIAADLNALGDNGPAVAAAFCQLAALWFDCGAYVPSPTDPSTEAACVDPFYPFVLPTGFITFSANVSAGVVFAAVTPSPSTSPRGAGPGPDNSVALGLGLGLGLGLLLLLVALVALVARRRRRGATQEKAISEANVAI
jgi:hypothetical protein